MIVWTLDPDVYGLPDYGLKTGQSRTFAPYLGDKGAGRYTSYNRTAPAPTQLLYHWRGNVLAQFRAAWEDRNRLAFGANWMRVTLPVDLHIATEYNVHFTGSFAATLTAHDWWAVLMSVDLDMSPLAEFA